MAPTARSVKFPTMHKDHDAVLAAQVAEAVSAAKTQLAERMSLRGLTRERGWRLQEAIRTIPAGHEFVFRPIHIHEMCEDLEVTVRIDRDGQVF